MERLLCVIALCLSGCTTMSFESKGLISVSISPRPGHSVYAEASGDKEFYLWGLIGPDKTVYLDTVLGDKGLVSAANVTVEEYQTAKQRWIGLLSFGMFIPKSYKVRAFGIAPKQQRRKLKRKGWEP